MPYAKIKNSTRENICVYGPPREGDYPLCGARGNEECHNSGYILSPFKETPDFWDCDGFLLPNDRYFVSPHHRGPIKGPAAIKYKDTKGVEIFKEGNNYKCVGSKDDGFFRAGEIQWEIQDVNAATFQREFSSHWYVPGSGGSL